MNALCKLLADPVYRQGMGANAAEFVRRKFSREAMAEGMERLYLQLREAR